MIVPLAPALNVLRPALERAATSDHPAVVVYDDVTNAETTGRTLTATLLRVRAAGDGIDIHGNPTRAQNRFHLVLAANVDDTTPEQMWALAQTAQRTLSDKMHWSFEDAVFNVGERGSESLHVLVAEFSDLV